MKQQKPATKTTKTKTTKAKATKTKASTKVKAKKTVAPEQNSQEPKVFDVAAPGKTVADANARPVIVTNRTSVKDPMVTPVSTEATETPDVSAMEEDSSEGISSAKIRIEPLHSDVKAAEIQPAVGTPAETTNTNESAPAADNQPAQPEAPEANKTIETPPPAEAADDDGDEDELGDLPNDDAKQAANKAAEAEAKAEEERRAKAEALINNKQYFVPINAVKKRKSARVVIIFVAVIAVLAGLVVALDAGLLDLGITPPTDFISD